MTLERHERLLPLRVREQGGSPRSRPSYQWRPDGDPRSDQSSRWLARGIPTVRAARAPELDVALAVPPAPGQPKPCRLDPPVGRACRDSTNGCAVGACRRVLVARLAQSSTWSEARDRGGGALVLQLHPLGAVHWDEGQRRATCRCCCSTPYAGLIVDRADKRTVLLITHGAALWSTAFVSSAPIGGDVHWRDQATSSPTSALAVGGAALRRGRDPRRGGTLRPLPGPPPVDSPDSAADEIPVCFTGRPGLASPALAQNNGQPRPGGACWGQWEYCCPCGRRSERVR